MQNRNDFPALLTSNVFSNQFEAFQKTRLFQRLEKKFTPLPYYRKYKLMRWIAFTASYLFNIFSALTASTLVYFFVLGVSGSWWLSGSCTLAFIILIEIAKRNTNGIFWKDWLQYKKLSYSLLVIVGLLIGLSVTFSYFGSKQLVERFSAAPQLIINDTLTAPIETELASIDLQIKAARKTKWQGTTTSTSQRTIETLSRQKLALQERLLSIENRTDANNEKVIQVHEKAVYLKSEYFALVTLFLELLFILCAFYLEYYDYRSFAEFSKGDKPKNNRSDIATNSNANLVYTKPEHQLHVTTNGNHSSNYKSPDRNNITVIDNTPNDVIDKAAKLIKGRIASANYRLRNGIGKPETSIKNIEKFTNELKELKGLIHQVYF